MNPNDAIKSYLKEHVENGDVTIFESNDFISVKCKGRSQFKVSKDYLKVKSFLRRNHFDNDGSGTHKKVINDYKSMYETLNADYNKLKLEYDKLRIIEERFSTKPRIEGKRIRRPNLVNKTLDDILASLNDWNFEEYGVINQVSMGRKIGKGQPTVGRYWPQIKDRVEILNQNYKKKIKKQTTLEFIGDEIDETLFSEDFKDFLSKFNK